MLSRLDALARGLRRLRDSAALVARLHDVAVVREPVKQRRGHLGVAEHGAPLGQVQAGRDDDAGVLVELGHQMEQQGATALAERQVAQLVEGHQVQPQQAGCDAPSLAFSLLPRPRVDQVQRGVEPHALAVSADARHAEGRGLVGLARARPAYQHHVVRCRRELACGQLRNSLRSTGETSKSKRARSRYTGNRAAHI